MRFESKINIGIEMNSSSQRLIWIHFLKLFGKMKGILIDVFQLFEYRCTDFLRSLGGFIQIQPLLNISKIEFKIAGYPIRPRAHFINNPSFLFSMDAINSSFEREGEAMDWLKRHCRYSSDIGKPSAAKLMRWKLPDASRKEVLRDASLGTPFISAWLATKFRKASSLAGVLRCIVYEFISLNLIAKVSKSSLNPLCQI